MKFFLDNMFSAPEARSLAALFDGEHSAEHLCDRWPRGDASDEEWMRALQKEDGWVILTYDRAMTRQHGHLIELHRRSKNRAVFFAGWWATQRVTARHSRLLACFERLVRELERSEPGTVLHLGARGTKLRRL